MRSADAKEALDRNHGMFGGVLGLEMGLGIKETGRRDAAAKCVATQGLELATQG